MAALHGVDGVEHVEEVADLMIDTVEKWAPGFKASVIARQINSPLDLERTFGLVNGDIMHGVNLAILNKLADEFCVCALFGKVNRWRSAVFAAMQFAQP